MTASPDNTEPAQADIHAIIKLYSAGRLDAAEAQTRKLLKAHPRVSRLHNLLGACLAGQGRLDEAVKCYRDVLDIDSSHAGAQNNLGLALMQLGDEAGAEQALRRAVALDPSLAEAHQSLGALVHRHGEVEEAARHYRLAVKAKPDHAAAWKNLGSALETLNQPGEAETAYRRAIEADLGFAEAYNGLGGVLRTQGKLENAAECCRKAAELKPDYAAAFNNLGSILKAQGRLDEAAAEYRRALALNPDMPEAHYNLGLTLQADNRLEEAAGAYEAANIRDAGERAALCYYKTRQFDTFRTRLAALSEGAHVSPLTASLSAHHARNFQTEDAYRFCPQPAGFIHKGHVSALTRDGSGLRAALLRDIEAAEIEDRKQKLLHQGVQSSGHLFQRPEQSFADLAALIRDEIERYRQTFAGADCVYIQRFPEKIEFTGAWYVKMKQGGHLEAHIHEGGWLSGVVYLAMPQARSGDEGNIGFSVQGGGYPKLRDDFPETIMPVGLGDIVLFPSSLFHRTIPFAADEDRICVSFDLKPAASA
ncbi:tetratricopeptide repeat protein [Euryhalocaulis caribicus]|uniref:tetratricopeptide repeat protein n=1 Tax=Euryhalocaulis caribicus TaxID=1161401 RepID=UPI00039D01FE|nr:tetratricopeptide repeat protein [Euryhalocaulis caribicus]